MSLRVFSIAFPLFSDMIGYFDSQTPQLRICEPEGVVI